MPFAPSPALYHKYLIWERQKADDTKLDIASLFELSRAGFLEQGLGDALAAIDRVSVYDAGGNQAAVKFIVGLEAFSLGRYIVY